MTNKTLATTVAEETVMPAFTEVIRIEVEVNSIYEKLLDTFPADYKHRHILSHAIIGSSVESGKINYIYNALHGYTNQVNFQVGDWVICTGTERSERYDANEQNENGECVPQPVSNGEPTKPNWKSRRIEIGSCKVVEVNLYRDSKLKVEFMSQDRYQSEPATNHAWVNHKICTKEVVA